MEPRAQGRRSFAYRLSTLLALCIVALVGLSACGDGSPYSTISPRTDLADDIQGVYKIVFYLSLVVFVGVQVGIVYTVLRYRRRHDDDERPEQVHGNKTLEIVWTILPAVVLLLLFIPTVQILYDHAADAEENEGDYVIEVYGKQWWWEVHYRRPDAVADVITANEIRVPVGQKVIFKLYTNNVIHSFWVPQLAGKMDLIPGHENELAFTVPQPGVYFGECAEFCGDQHAWMRFQVIAEPQEQFDAWIEAWRAGPSQAAAAITGDVAQAPESAGICITCHRIEGTNLSVAPVGIEQNAETSKIAGPNLTLFGCRNTIAAGLLENTPENLAKWLDDPESVKPGNHMSGSPAGIHADTLSPEQITELVDYLMSLTPEGGCPEPTGENADLIAQDNGQ